MGIQPCKTDEPVNCPVCWEKVGHKSITGDVDCEVKSLADTIEPYESNYLRESRLKDVERMVVEMLRVHPDGLSGSVIIGSITSCKNAKAEDIQQVFSKMVKEGNLRAKRLIMDSQGIYNGDVIYILNGRR